MIHDVELTDALGAFPIAEFRGQVFRATRISLDPTAPSTSGGRWASAGDVQAPVSVLYTSLERQGALAEIAYHWSQLTPLPSKPAVVHRLDVAADRTLRLVTVDLERLGVRAETFQDRVYNRTQQIGAACAFLGCDGLLVPSARWSCENLVLFTDNLRPDGAIAVASSEEVDWQAWGTEAGVLPRT